LSAKTVEIQNSVINSRKALSSSMTGMVLSAG